MNSEARYSSMQDDCVKQSLTLIDNQDFFNRKQEQFSRPSFYGLENSNFQAPVLTDTFYYNDKMQEDQTLTIKCTIQDIVVYPSKDLFYQTSFDQKDLIGAEIFEGKEIQSKKPHRLQIILMVKQTKGGCCSNKLKRGKVIRTLFHHDYEKLRIWQNLIQHIARDPRFLLNEFPNLTQLQLTMFNYKFLVFINPKSGPGKAKQLWKRAKGLLQIAGYVLTEIFTERQNHARDIILQIPSQELLQFSGIITVSGDGLPHEVVNALAQREDADQALKIGVAPLPAGSGNALLKNIAAYSNELEDIDGATYQIIKHNKLDIDLVECNFENSENEGGSEKVYSFLSLSCSYIADVDLNSESLRCMGEARFDLWGVYRVLCQKEIQLNIDITRVSDHYLVDEARKKKNKGKKTRQNKSIQQFSQNSNLQSILEEEEDMVIEDKKSLSSNNLQQSNIPVHKEKFKGKCKYLILQNMPYLSTSNYTAPHSEMNDGFLDFQFLINSSWCSLLNQALDFQNGKQFKKQKDMLVPKSKSLRHRMVTEFIIESQDGNEVMYSIDGEKYMATVLKGKVLPGKFTIFCCNKN